MTAAWVGVGATFFAVFVALFKETILARLYHPELKASIVKESPYCRMAQRGIGFASGSGVGYISKPAYELRLRIENTGTRRAENVQVNLVAVHAIRSLGTPDEYPMLTTRNLTWVRTESGQNLVFMPVLQQGCPEYCQLAHIFSPRDRGARPPSVLFAFEIDESKASDDKTLLSLDIADRSYDLAHLLGPGTYQFRVIVSADNAKPVEISFRIALTGLWCDEEAQMQRKGIDLAFGSQNLEPVLTNAP